MARHTHEAVNKRSSLRARQAHARARREFVTYDTSPIRPKKSKKGIYVALVVLAVIAILFGVLIFSGCSDNRGSLPSDQSATVEIESGDTPSTVAQKFVDSKLVADASRFVDMMKETGADVSIIPGQYTFSGGTQPKAIAEAIKAGKSDVLPTVTIVEGYTIAASAAALESESSGRISADQFIQATSNASVYASEFSFLTGVGENSLEGFLFPKTYNIEKSDDATSMVKKMLEQFRAETANLDYSFPTSRGLDLYQTVKLASIVEKECSGDGRQTVAGIFYNRLASSSPYLQSDATTAYVVGHDPTGEEVHADDPYSTYSNPGLPPTPICSPSLAVLQATCTPEQTNYNFFYTNKDGSYAFSTTYQEHQAAIAADNQ